MAEFCNKCAKKQGLYPDRYPLLCEGCGNYFEKTNLITQIKKKMKKLLFLTVLLATAVSFAQNFPGNDVELLLGKNVKPKSIEESLQKYSYKNFYVKFDTISKKLEKYKKNHRLLPVSETVSDYDKLVGKEFKVVNIFEQKSLLSSDNGRYSILVLENDELGKVFYNYDSKYDFNFELEVIGGLDLPEGFYCKDIEVSKDKFDGKITHNTPYSEGISFIKVIDKNVEHIYISVREPGSTPNVGKKGLILLLKNDQRIDRPEAKIDVDVSGKNYVYSTFIELNDNEVDLIIENPITDNRLYIYDGAIKNGEKLSEYLKCLK